MSTYAVYRLSDGIVVGHKVCPPRQLARNTPSGCAAIDGELDAPSQRIDVQLMEASRGDFSPPSDFVVDYQPPKPDDDHEWRENVFNGRPRWVKRDDVVRRENRDRVARARLNEITLAKVRPLTELVKDAQDGAARAVLDELEAEAVELRKDVIRTADETERADRLQRPPAL